MSLLLCAMMSYHMWLSQMNFKFKASACRPLLLRQSHSYYHFCESVASYVLANSDCIIKANTMHYYTHDLAI